MPEPSPPGLYRHSPLAARVHTAIRWRLFDFSQLAPYVPDDGTFVDIGCGHGLWLFYLAQLRPEATLWGIDPDAAKIGIAQEVARRHGYDQITFAGRDVQGSDLPGCTLASLIDVLYLVPTDSQKTILSAVVDHLEPGGRLLLKEIDTRPRWKYAWNLAQETLTVRLLGITYGDSFTFRAGEEWADLLTDLGLAVTIKPLHRGTLHPHVLVIGDRR